MHIPILFSAILVKDVHQCLSKVLYSPLLHALNANLVDMDFVDQAC